MFQPDAVMQYVDDVEKSAAFYAALLDSPVQQHGPGFALARLADGRALGLWRRADVQPPVSAAPGANELAMVVDNAEEVEQLHARWKALGVTILLPPVTLGFGHTFVGEDLDGHRLRVYSRAQDLPPR